MLASLVDSFILELCLHSFLFAVFPWQHLMFINVLLYSVNFVFLFLRFLLSRRFLDFFFLFFMTCSRTLDVRLCPIRTLVLNFKWTDHVTSFVTAKCDESVEDEKPADVETLEWFLRVFHSWLDVSSSFYTFSDFTDVFLSSDKEHWRKDKI